MKSERTNQKPNIMYHIVCNLPIFPFVGYFTVANFHPAWPRPIAARPHRRLTLGGRMMAGEKLASGLLPLAGVLKVPSDDSAGSKNADMTLLKRMPLWVLNLEPK